MMGVVMMMEFVVSVNWRRRRIRSILLFLSGRRLDILEMMMLRNFKRRKRSNGNIAAMGSFGLISLVGS
jgi:hypothetical protein